MRISACKAPPVCLDTPHATVWPVRLSVRTPGFQPGKRGSIPLRAATHTPQIAVSLCCPLLCGKFKNIQNTQARRDSRIETVSAIFARESPLAKFVLPVCENFQSALIRARCSTQSDGNVCVATQVDVSPIDCFPARTSRTMSGARNAYSRVC